MKHETAIPIGSGGMGEVFKAWDPDLERHIALKYLHHDDPVLVERLMREARAQARIDHPSVCKVYEVGSDDGRPYIAMEYVDGVALDVAAKNLTLEKKIVLIKEITEAVQAAHSAGLIHRDLKPANILVADHPDHLHPYILDFGIARIEEVAGLTNTGQVIGTPGYLSPEQARGDVKAIDRRTDVFSLGVILYELLGGEKPFDGDSNVEILVNLIESEPVPLRKRVPSIPRDLNTIVMSCLEKEPGQRYPSARLLADDLDHFLRGEPVEAKRTGVLTRVRLRARKNPRTFVAAAVALIAMLMLAGLALNERRTAARRAEIAQNFGREIERMDGLLEHAYLLPLHDTRPDREHVRQRMALIDAQLEDLDPVSQALGHYVIGRGHLALGEASQAQQRLQRAWELGDRSPELNFALGLSLAELHRTAVLDAAAIRNTQRREAAILWAETTYRDPARDHLQASGGGTEHPAYLGATLADVSGNREEALIQLDQLRVDEPFFYQADLLAGSIHRGAFEEASLTGDKEAVAASFASAEAAFRSAARVGESDPRSYYQLCGLWVGALRNQFWESGGDLAPLRDAALEACGDALTADPSSVPAHIEAGRAHRYWASNEQSLGRSGEENLLAARRHAQAAIEEDSENSTAYVLLGVTHRIAASGLMGRGEDPREEFLGAVAAYREAIRIRSTDSGAHMSLANALLYLGDHARSQGKAPDDYFQAAADAAQEAVSLQPEIVGGHVNQGIAYAQLGITAREQGRNATPDFDHAAAAFERAIELNPNFYTAHYNLGETLLEASIDELRRGLDPTPKLTKSLEMLDAAAVGYPDWAAPRYLQAEALSLKAEYARTNNGDPADSIERAKEAIASGRAINPNDATGLSRSSLAFLVDAKWRRQRGLDPSPAVATGLATMDDTIAANPNLAAAHVRRAELLLLRAAWRGDSGLSPAPDLDDAAAALSRAAEINPSDAGIPALEAEMWRRRAELQSASKTDPAEAIALGLEAAKRSIETDPGRATAWIERAHLEHMAGNREGAESAATEARRLDPRAELPEDM